MRTLEGCDAVYVINMDHDLERLGSFYSQVAAMGFYPEDIIRIKGPKTEIGSYGCALAHRNVVRDAVKKGYKRVAVFEDDILLRFSGSLTALTVSRAIKDLDAFCVKEKREWAILYMGCTPAAGSFSVSSEVFINDSDVVRELDFKCFGEFAQILNIAEMKNVYEDIPDSEDNFKASLRSDMLILDKISRKKCFVISPMLVCVKDAPSRTGRQLYKESAPAPSTKGCKNMGTYIENSYFTGNLTSFSPNVIHNIMPVTVSVIMAAYKTPFKMLTDSLDSIFRQCVFLSGRVKFEVLLGIDGKDGISSTEIEILTSRYPKMLKIYLSEDNNGPFMLKNALFQRSMGKYVLFFDSDDLLHPKSMLKMLSACTKAAILRYKVHEIPENYDFLPVFKEKELFYPVNSAPTSWFAYGSVFMPRAVMEALGGYQPWKCAADKELAIRSMKYFGEHCLDEPLYCYRKRDNSIMRNKETSWNSAYRASRHVLIDALSKSVSPEIHIYPEMSDITLAAVGKADVALNMFTNCTGKNNWKDTFINTWTSFTAALGAFSFSSVHIDAAPDTGSLEANVKLLIALGFDVHVTSGLKEGYIESVKNASAAFAMQLEHDWQPLPDLTGSLNEITDVMKKSGAYHMRFNKRSNSEAVWDKKVSEVTVTLINGSEYKICTTDQLSNNPHIIDIYKYRKNVLEVLKNAGPSSGSSGIEEVLSWNKGLTGHLWGGYGKGPYINHTDGRGEQI